MSPPSRPRFQKIFSHLFFTAWAGGTLGLVSWLGASHVMAPMAPSADPENVEIRAAGWAMVHWLRSDDADSLRVADQLVQRRLPAFCRDEIRVVGAGGRLSERLAAAGWRVVVVPDGLVGEYPRMDIVDPGDRTAWSGLYIREDLRTSGAIILDELVMTRVARGDRLPPVVPAACVTRLQR